MTRTAISVDHIARVEGHGNVHLSIKDGAVETCEMNVVEPARLFESMVVGRKFADVPYIASRVCGICSASHVITDILAIERIFGVEVTDRTRALRELLVYGSYLQNHASHLFVFAAPDFLDMASVFPLAKTNPELFDQALGLKSLGNQLCNLVGGRSIHPITAVVGGFTHEPTRDEYLAMADKLDTICGLFAIGQGPTGSSDPFALRRAAIGIVSILFELPGVSLLSAIDVALERYAEAGIAFDRAAVRAAVVDFFVTRTKVMLRDEGRSPDAIDAVLAVGVEEPMELVRRVRALEAARTDARDTFDDLATAYARANNLADPALGTQVDEALLGEAERDLARAVEVADAACRAALAADDYAGALAALAVYLIDAAKLEGLLPTLMEKLSLFERFYPFVNGIFDWTSVVFYGSVIVFFLFLTVMSLEKRRYN